MITPKNILIVRTDRIGDVILTIPLAEIIKKFYPQSKITFFIREYTKDLFYDHPFVDKIILLKQRNGKILFGDNLREIANNNFDVVLCVSPSFILSLILLFSKIKIRVGTGYRWYSFLFNRRINEHRKYGTKHELDHNVRLLKGMGIDFAPDESNVSFNIQTEDKNEQYISSLLKNQKLNSGLPTIIIHPGSSGSAIDLPISKFKQLAEMVAQQLNVNIIVTGSSKEKEICGYLSKNIDAHNFAGLLNLGELIVLIKNADLLIANSTGPIHIAAALGKNVIGFYPKIKACSVTRWGPYTKKKHIFSPTILCENCTRKQCQKLDCMNSIDVNKVFEKVKEIFSKLS
ncbi:MAG: glycosyltransferase family 9 protein [bacterium]